MAKSIKTMQEGHAHISESFTKVSKQQLGLQEVHDRQDLDNQVEDQNYKTGADEAREDHALN